MFTLERKVGATVTGLVLLSVGAWVAMRYELADSLLSTRFMPHQYCYLRDPGLIWTNAISDGLIWLAYVAIAIALAALLRKTRALLAFRWAFVGFGLFIVACGFTHFFEVVTLWKPLYWLASSIKVLTAAASLVTAIAFAPLVPRAAEAIRLFHERYSKSEEQRSATLSRLLDTEQRMALAMESAGVGIWDLNPIDNKLHWDERCRSLFGVANHEEASYRDFMQCVYPDDRAGVEASLNTALQENREYNAGFRVQTDDGEIRHVIARGRPLYNDMRQAVRFVGTVIDVSRERQAEEALLRTEKLAVAGRMAASIAH